MECPPTPPFFFFSVKTVKCGQRLKQHNKCTSLHKGQYSIQSEHLIFEYSLCVFECRNTCAPFHDAAFNSLFLHSKTHLCNVWFMQCGVLTYTFCCLEIKECYLCVTLLLKLSNNEVCVWCFLCQRGLLKAVKSACRPDAFVSCGIN